MSLKNIYSLYKTHEKENILLSFKGVVTSDLVTSILQIMESKLSCMDESPKLKKKVFNVLVECLQNLYHHLDGDVGGTDSERLEINSALFFIARVDDSFFVKTGNYIDKETAKTLEDRMSLINGMEKDELKMYYQKVLNEGAMSSKGTAGLGMIDIARKSGNKLGYEFVDVDEDYRFFCLNIKID
jgi:hypothetical protein